MDRVLSYAQMRALERQRKKFTKFIFEIPDLIGHDSFGNDIRDGGTDPKEDFWRIQKEADKRGFTLGEISKLFLRRDNAERDWKKNDFQKWFFDNGLGSQYDWGWADVYLYGLNNALNLNGIVGLGGTSLDDDKIETYASTIKNPHNNEDIIVKYSYGIHRSKYGKILLKQGGVTEDEFKRIAFDHIADEILYSFTYEFCVDNVVSEDFFDKGENDFIIRLTELTNHHNERVAAGECDSNRRDYKELTIDDAQAKSEQIIRSQIGDRIEDIMDNITISDEFVRVTFSLDTW